MEQAMSQWSPALVGILALLVLIALFGAYSLRRIRLHLRAYDGKKTQEKLIKVEKIIKQTMELCKNNAFERRLSDDLEKAQKKLANIEGKIKQVEVLCECGLGNQVILSSMAGKKKTLSLPSASQKQLYLEIDDQGRLCFKYPDPNQLMKPPIFINTVPKSGTYFLGAVLGCLGYQDIEIHAMRTHLSDYRGKTKEEKLSHYWSYSVGLNFEAQASLVLPGQYLIGHVDGDVFRNTVRGSCALIMARDLRYSMVSGFRFSYLRENRTEAAEITPADLCKTCKSGFGKYIINFAKHICGLKNDFPMIRFEELTSCDRDIANPSLQAISKATECTMDEVFEALLKASKFNTLTYSGEHSQLGDYWTPEVEEAFVTAGGDILNEELGYPRTINFGS